MTDQPETTRADLERLLSEITPGPWSIRFRKDGSAIMSMGGIEPGQAHKQFNIGLHDDDPSDGPDARAIAMVPDLLRMAIAALNEQGEADQ